MQKTIALFVLTVLISSCNLLENKEKKAIEVCQKAKVQVETDNAFANLFINAYGLGANATWLDFANMVAKKGPNKKYDWIGKETDEKNIYLVSFVDSEGWGQRWEVDIEQQIVKFVNQNEYLSRKYGLSRVGGADEFEITDEKQSELMIDKHHGYFDETSSSKVVYVLIASVINKTNKSITSATINGKLKLIFKDKTVSSEGNYDSGFKTGISESRPWEPNTARNFYIKTKGMEKIYLGYVPEYVLFDVSLKAEDPIGYTFDKDINEIDLKNNWTAFKENSANTKDENMTTNSNGKAKDEGKHETDEYSEQDSTSSQNE